MLEVKAVIKTFDSTRAVDGITFSAKPGEIFGLISPGLNAAIRGVVKAA